MWYLERVRVEKGNMTNIFKYICSLTCNKEGAFVIMIMLLHLRPKVTVLNHGNSLSSKEVKLQTSILLRAHKYEMLCALGYPLITCNKATPMEKNHNDTEFHIQTEPSFASEQIRISVLLTHQNAKRYSRRNFI